MQDDAYKNYLCDLCFLLRDKAIEAKNEKINALNTKDEEYQTGYLMAFYEVVSLIKQQAYVFEIDLKKLGLENIDPELDLL